MTLPLRFACLCLLPLALAACKGEKKKPAAGGTAQGEILPGSASDAMLPLDSVRSQPPFAPVEVPTGKAGKSNAAADEAVAAASDEAAPMPTVTPSIVPAPAATQ
jgi:hypothetical protein